MVQEEAGGGLEEEFVGRCCGRVRAVFEGGGECGVDLQGGRYGALERRLWFGGWGGCEVGQEGEAVGV